MRGRKDITAQEYETLQQRTFYGKEKKSLAYIIGIMNMILHGIEAPNILHTNTLGENISDIQEKDRVDVVLANPPFGGSERAEIQENFPIRSSETAYLFLQHFIKILRQSGRCGVVIKNTFLSNLDAATLRKELLTQCDLHTVLILPAKVFSAGVQTVVLFFEKGKATKDIWLYELTTDKNFGKNNPITESHLAEFKNLQKNRECGDSSWIVSVKNLDENTWEIPYQNPNKVEVVDERTPTEILLEIENLDKESEIILSQIRELL